jgi:ribose 5-phosphate isomerase A
MTAEDQKRAAGEAATTLVESGMTVGLGTGSTAACFVRALAPLRLAIRCVATSEATAALAASLGLEMLDIDAAGAIDLTVDGADEIGPGLALIKGGGAALLREKLTWSISRRCIVIADASKALDKLGKYPLPVEVVAFGHTTTAARIAQALADCGMGASPRLRLAADGPVRTDGGNLIYDLACEAIEDPAALAAALKRITGVVDHGLFLNFAERALIGTERGVTTLYP